MTRYARAKGSKASNERLPNDATPWRVMKEQLEESKNKKPIEKRKSAKELLKDQNDIYYSNTLGNIKCDWADFNDDKSKSNTKTHTNLEAKKDFTESFETHDNTSHTVKTNDSETSQEVRYTKTEKSDQNTFSNEKEQHMDSHPHFNRKKINTSKYTDLHGSLSKRQKRNQRKKLKMSESKNIRTDKPENNFCNQVLKTKKIKEKGEYKRRKPDVGITKMIINGVEVEIVKYDGFPIKKEDAERLTELKQKLIMKGIPKSEIDVAMKLERRKAEKALARTKKVVCFQCRKSGHNLSDCPELGNNGICTGICFKCGSTEHTHYECKVNKNSAYRYATCFICREQGHIAAQCPDNPRGIYPQGGSCKICGAVTHLKKDCPDLVKTKEDSTTITVEKMTDSGVESL